MVSLNPMSVNIQTIILGNVLAIAPADIAQLAIIGAVSLTILLLKWKDLMVVFSMKPMRVLSGLIRVD